MDNVTQTTVYIDNGGFSVFSMVFRAYCEPILCLISVCGSIAILIGMARVKDSFSSSVRFYYTVFSICELLVVCGYFFAGDFLQVGVGYLVSGGEYYPISTYDASVWACKLLFALWMGPDYVLGLTLVCLGIERIVCVIWPLKAKMLLTLRNSIILEVTVNLLIVGSFLPLLLIDYTIDPELGYCNYDFRLPFTTFYIMFESGIPLMSSFVSFGISTFLIIKVISVKMARTRISTGKGISASELSNIATLLLLDLAHLVVYIPDGIFLWIYSLTEVNPEIVSTGFTYIIYRLADICDVFTLVPHTLTFFIHFFRSHAFRKALFGRCIS